MKLLKYLICVSLSELCQIDIKHSHPSIFKRDPYQFGFFSRINKTKVFLRKELNKCIPETSQEQNLPMNILAHLPIET